MGDSGAGGSHPSPFCKSLFSLNQSHHLCAPGASPLGMEGDGSEPPSSCRSSFPAPPVTTVLSPVFLPMPRPTPRLQVDRRGEGEWARHWQVALHLQLWQSNNICPLQAQAWSLALTARQSSQRLGYGLGLGED